MSDTVEHLIERGRALRATIAARADDVPNLRDFGLDRRADYEAAITAYHAETARLDAEYQEVGRQRHALRAAQRAR